MTTGGPPGNTCPRPFATTLKWLSGGMGAAPPAAGPSTTVTTGATLTTLHIHSNWAPSGM